MALYAYTAVAPGEPSKRVTIEADNQREAEQKLRSLKLLPVRFHGEVDAAHSNGAIFRASKIDVLGFTSQLAPLLSSSIPLERAIAIIAEGTAEPEQKQFVVALRQGLHEGKKFSELTRGYGTLFPGYYANLIETGEETGCLPEVTGELQRFMEESRELKDFIVTSSIYPMVVLTITVVVMILMFTVFVPQFARTFANMGRELPGSMVFLMTLSTVMSYAVWLVPLGLISLWFGLRSYLGIDRLRELRAAAMLRIPVLGKLIVELEIGKFIRTLSILVSNHVDIIKTVRIATRVIQNPLIRKSFDDVEPRLRGGEKLSAALTGNPFVPPSLPSRLRVGEESGNSGLMLVRAAVYLEEGARRSIKRLLGLFEPMIIIVLALGIAIVVVSIFLAVMEMNSIPGS